MSNRTNISDRKAERLAVHIHQFLDEMIERTEERKPTTSDKFTIFMTDFGGLPSEDFQSLEQAYEKVVDDTCQMFDFERENQRRVVWHVMYFCLLNLAMGYKNVTFKWNTGIKVLTKARSEGHPYYAILSYATHKYMKDHLDRNN